MMVYEDPNAIRESIAAEVEAQARRDGIHDLTTDEIHRVCADRIAAAFVKARLCPKAMNTSHRRIAAHYATAVADRLLAA